MKIRKIINIIAVVGIIVTCIAPYILTQCNSNVVFDQNSGVIGDTIGGNNGSCYRDSEYSVVMPYSGRTDGF